MSDILKSSMILGLYIDEERLLSLGKRTIPELEGKSKGEAGKVCVIGGSTEYTGAPYFAAISSLKIGADLVYVITTENAAPVIKSYSPDLIVYPYLNSKDFPKMITLLDKMDMIIIGPGLGREDEIMQLTYDIIEACKVIKKPLIIDADGLYAISNNVTIIKDYPLPGAILTPNNKETKTLITAISSNSTWYTFWGDNVSVLHKGGEDHYYSSIASFGWTLSKGGSGRRAGGQGDILSGALGTFYTWALKYELCDKEKSVQLAQSVAVYAAARFTRMCNQNAYAIYGRSMTASDMINQIHSSFDTVVKIGEGGYPPVPPPPCGTPWFRRYSWLIRLRSAASACWSPSATCLSRYASHGSRASHGGHK